MEELAITFPYNSLLNGFSAILKVSDAMSMSKMVQFLTPVRLTAGGDFIY